MAEPDAKPPIEVELEGGHVLEFPADTPREVVLAKGKEYAEKFRDKTTTMQQVVRGMVDPMIGFGQLASHILPGDAPGDARIRDAKRSRGEHVYTPPSTADLDQWTREREEQIQKERGGSKNVDWARMSGEILSPANFLFGGLGVKAGEAIVEPITRRLLSPGLKLATETTASGVAGGGATGVLNPEADPKAFAKKKLAEFGLGSMIGGGIGGAGGAAAGALTGWGSYLARTHPDNLTSDAVVKILKRFKQDQKAGGPSATDALDLVEAARKPIALVDTGPQGGNVEGLAGHVARRPGESRAVARGFLVGDTGRDAGAAARLQEDISRHVTSGPSAFQATEGMLESQHMASSPIYAEAYKQQNVWSPRLEEFLNHPEMRKALDMGWKSESMQSLARKEAITASQMGVDVGIDGSTKLLGKPNVRVLDMAKRGLDAMIAKERDPLTGRLSSEGRDLNMLKQAYVEAIDEADTSGLYKKARKTWAGYEASMDAINMGKTIFKSHPEEMAAEVAKMSPADREFFRIGVADIMRERLLKAGAGGDEAKQIAKNGWTEKVLRPAFDNKADYEAFVDAVTAERNMFERAGRMLGGSASAERLGETVDSNTENLLAAGKMAAHAAIGNLLGMVKGAWSFYKDIGLKPNPELNEKIAQILFTTNVPEDAAKMLRSGVIPPRVNPKAAQAGGIADASATMGAMAGQSAGEAMDSRRTQ
jgi:hypothetical protein